MVSSLRYLLLAASSVGLIACGQQTHPVTNRTIAPVMGVGGADWLDRRERASEEGTKKALAALELKPGMQVGDVGAGTGFYSLRMAQFVLPSGTVYANDLQPAMLRKIAAKAKKQLISNVKEVQGTESDCKLPEGALDLVLMVDVYHEFSRPREMLRSIRRSLKEGGRIVLLEYRGEDESVPIRPEHKMTLKQVKAEVTPERFRFEKSVETLPWQHMVFFRKADGEK